MNDLKHCSRCGVVISNINTADYYRHIRIKYCDVCREQVRREQAAVRVHNLRQRRRQKNKLLDERLELLEEENKLLRERVAALREYR
ncbi:MAG: hypothetical protein IJX77_10135 [Ruminococcus sp.]|nr:hypothetical protein [Ruminococcus sp.]